MKYSLKFFYWSIFRGRSKTIIHSPTARTTTKLYQIKWQFNSLTLVKKNPTTLRSNKIIVLLALGCTWKISYHWHFRNGETINNQALNKRASLSLKQTLNEHPTFTTKQKHTYIECFTGIICKAFFISWYKALYRHTGNLWKSKLIPQCFIKKDNIL